MSEHDRLLDQLYGPKPVQQPHPSTGWMVPGKDNQLKPFTPEYDLEKASPDGAFGSSNAMSQAELYDYLQEQGGESALANPQQFIQSDPKIMTGGSRKMVLPVYKDTLKPSTNDISLNRFGNIDRQSFILVPEGASPNTPPEGWGNAGDFSGNQDELSKRYMAMRRHFGTDASLASSFKPEEEKPKIFPDLPFLAPGVPTLLSSGFAAGGSFIDVLRDRNSWDVAQGMAKATDDKGIEASLDRAGGIYGKKELIPMPGLNDFTRERLNALKDIRSRYNEDQLNAMSPDELRRIAVETIKTQRLGQIKGDVADQQYWDKLRSSGVWDYRTKEYGEDWKNLSMPGIASKLTQETAGSAAPTILPMVASLAGSATRVPGAGYAAMGATTYELSANSEINRLMQQWAASKGVPMNASPEAIVSHVQGLINEDPNGFKNEIKSMINEARMSGALEAGLAIGLNKLVDGFKIPGAQEGSVLQAARHGFQPRVARTVLIPRIKNAIQEMGREAAEESMTELLKALGMGTYRNAKNGQSVTDAFSTALQDYSAKDGEAAMEAGAVGAYMSFLSKLITGKGNPDTALMVEARRKAAAQLSAQNGKPVEQNDEQLARLARGLKFAEEFKKAELESLFSGQGTLEDQMNPRVPDPVPQEQPYTQLSGLFSGVHMNGSPVTFAGQRVVEPTTPANAINLAEAPRTSPNQATIMNNSLTANDIVLGPGETAPPPRVVNGKLRRFYRETIMPDGRRQLVDATYENAPK